MSENSRPRRLLSVTAAMTGLALVGVTVSSCQARPGDAPTVAAPETVQTSAPPAEDAPSTVESRTVTVGLDSLPVDLNPHLVSSRSLATSVVAELTLPSAFTVDGGDGGEGGGDGARTRMNTDLLDSVTVTGGDESAPTAVRYVLRSTAQWSDGTPITGSDFEYLRSQITTRPGVLDPAGYAMVDSVAVTTGGRTVDVTFTAPCPHWRELFADLLPSHIYRAEDRDFATMMSGVPAASAGVFRVRSVDAARGVIEMERNERYWGASPARVDRLVLSAVPDSRTASQMLRTGQLQMLMTAQQGVTVESLTALPGVQVRPMTRRPDLVLTLNTAAPRMAAAGNRTAVVDALDPDALARILHGDTAAVAPEADATGAGAAGMTESEGPGSDELELPAVDDGVTPLRIGADLSDSTAVEAARRVVDQLVDAGIGAVVVARPAADLYGSFLPRGAVDAVIAWQESPETLTELRSRYGCDSVVRPVTRPARDLPPVTTTPTATSTATPTATSAATRSGTATADPTTNHSAGRTVDRTVTDSPTGTAEPADADPVTYSGRTVNVSGICSALIDQAIDEAGEGTVGEAEAVDRVLGIVRGLALDVPLMSDRQVIAVGTGLAGPLAGLADWPIDRDTGPFVSAARWYRITTSDNEIDEEENQ